MGKFIDDQLKSEGCYFNCTTKKTKENEENKTLLNENQEFYYCSKSKKFPLKDVIRDIFDLFIEQNVAYLDFDGIYSYLLNKYNVSSFNRRNLENLLETRRSVSFQKVESLYRKFELAEHKNENNYSILRYFFVDHIQEMYSILNTLGVETLQAILENGLTPLLPVLNSMCEFCEDERKFELLNKRHDKVLQKKQGKILKDFVALKTDKEWIQLLQSADQTQEFLEEYIKAKEMEEERAVFKKYVFDKLELVHKDNSPARIEFLFPASISETMQKHNIFIMDDMKKINKKIADELFPFKNQLFEFLSRLQFSIPKMINERFIALLQMRSKNGVPNKLWKDWVAVLELRAEGATLEGAGSPLGITRERVRQVENRYLDEFSLFFTNELFNIQNYIKAFVEDPLFITDEDLLRLFPSNPKLFKYFLQSISSDDLIFIDEIDKFCFSEDASWYDDLLAFNENLPVQVMIEESEKYVAEAETLMEQKKCLLSAEDCRKIIFQNYKKLGIFYSRKNLRLIDRFKIIMRTYYPSPVNIYSAEFLSDFKRHYAKMYDGGELKSDHAITSILSRIGILVSRGEYVMNDRKFMSKPLADKILNYLNERENSIFLTNTIFHFFKEDLCAEGIDNKYFMTSAFKQWYGDKFFFKRDYISRSRITTNIYDEIINFIKEQKRVVTYDEVLRNFPATPWNILNFAFSNEAIINYRAKYVHVDNLHIKDEDISFLREFVSQTVSDDKIHHMDDLLSYIRLVRPDLLNKYYIQDQFSLYSFLEYLFDSEFELKRPFVAKNGMKIENQYDRAKAFVYSHEEVSISAFLDYIYNNKLHIYSIVEFVDSLEDYCFKDQEMLIELKKTGINKFNVEQLEQVILREMNEKDFLFADKIHNSFAFPKGVQWTPWLIYSAINKFGKELKAIPSDTKFSLKNVQYARPLIIRRNVPVKDINEFKKHLKNKLKMDETSFYKYLSSAGLA